ncbi:uncharacterized protein LOC104426365 [Eucalyptus grandis]|uniref:HTH myb-type domain-containing protein n=3 Tax=Eucalyptus grandis TaxID=71139 RepID=A0A059A5U2_EUCGR|nr:uncharacterized protein LOC104426365 [Eucalyptus grandis]XP_039160306.1 uncharacterized protein LOC104426365 [Eucalyptus grandis]XP_039160307.1 uncharacterized protein LOC104426365 [Eucalyptus grandis]KAK3406831.1 hypothetical protein EUGRSUZ_K02966 [Eucalyptus grandis]KAK3406832.1 hypothetical protein EUGRSUZ_K02966 [Eucalyptus grandis]
MKEIEGESRTECSEECQSSYQNKEEEEESDENEDESKAANGGSSSNSTVEEMSHDGRHHHQKKPSVRPYVRSKMPRLRWTPDLHLRFIHAIERLGGQDRATPKLVLQLMNIKGLSIAHVKSHLQMYRNKKIDDNGQVLADHRHLVECGENNNVYKLSQLPMLQGYSGQTSNFRYGDPCWRAGEYQMHNNPFSGWRSREETRPGLYGRVAEKLFGNKNGIWSNFLLGASSFNRQPNWTYQQEVKHPYISSRNQGTWKNIESRMSQIEHQRTAQLRAEGGENGNFDKSIASELKRKVDGRDIDLNLSLQVNQDYDEGHGSSEEANDVDSSLSLSLFSAKASKHRKLNDESKEIKEHGIGRASTLDLTL